jgi:hypothetical protein
MVMRLNRTTFRNIFCIVIVAVIAVLSIQILFLAKRNQLLRIDLGEVNHIRYSLLNIDEWSDQVGEVLAKNIQEFTVTPLNKRKLKTSIENLLYKLIDEVEVLMEDRTSGAFSSVKKWVASLAVDMDQLRDSVPSFSEEILIELERPETKQGLTDFLTSKLDEFSAATYNRDRMEVLQNVLEKYECVTMEECRQVLLERLDKKRVSINTSVILILGLVLVLFLIILIPKKRMSPFETTLLTFSSFCLLLGGIITPMIELEAKIDQLSFQLLGESIMFQDNVIFFQSKSITDMVHILMKEGTIQMIFVGMLIFMFSIVFPSAKLIGSLIYTYNFKNLKDHPVIRFFVIKSGKWSMADVMVVAIFMAYIGFNGIIRSQLESFTKAAHPMEVITTNGTQLLGGYFLFLFFCLSSLIISEALVRKRPEM